MLFSHLSLTLNLKRNSNDDDSATMTMTTVKNPGAGKVKCAQHVDILTCPCSEWRKWLHGFGMFSYDYSRPIFDNCIGSWECENVSIAFHSILHQLRRWHDVVRICYVRCVWFVLSEFFGWERNQQSEYTYYCVEFMCHVCARLCVCVRCVYALYKTM